MKLKKKKMKSKDSLYSNFDEVCLDEINADDAEVSTRKYIQNDDEKIGIIAGHFEEIMKTLGLDLNDDSLKETPERVAKMYVKEIFSGLNPKNKTEITTFENKYQYNKMLVEKNISLYSYCEHHFVPIIGKVHVAYISKGKVIGLSKINSLVQFYPNRLH